MPGYPLWVRGPQGQVVPLSPHGVPLASFGTRLAAYLLDFLVLLPAALLAEAAVLIPMMISFSSSDVFKTDPGSSEPPVFDASNFWRTWLLSAAGWVVALLFMLAISYWYFAVYQSRTGQTVGKRALKIKVVDLTTGAQMNRSQGNRRWLISGLASQLVTFLGIVDGLWQLWDKPYQQCLHDKVAQTIVVSAQPMINIAPPPAVTTAPKPRVEPPATGAAPTTAGPAAQAGAAGEPTTPTGQPVPTARNPPAAPGPATPPDSTEPRG